MQNIANILLLGLENHNAEIIKETFQKQLSDNFALIFQQLNITAPLNDKKFIDEFDLILIDESMMKVNHELLANFTKENNSIIFFENSTDLKKSIHQFKNLETHCLIKENLLEITLSKWVINLIERNRLQKKLLFETEQNNRFQYIISHDLRSPIQNQMQLLELIENDELKKMSEKTQELISKAISSGKKIDTLIKTIYKYTQIKLDESDLKTTSLENCLNIAMNSIQDLIKSKKVIINFKSLPDVFGSEKLITEVFQEILTNAIKFNHNQPVINVTSLNKEKETAIVFEDNGIGVEEKNHENVFEFLKKLHSPKQYPGLGAGLAICKKILNLHNGDIRIDSSSPTGTTFTLTLPHTEKRK